MTSLIALVKERPHNTFLHMPYLDSVRENILTAKHYYHELNTIEPTYLPETNKSNRRYNKALRDKIRNLIEQYERFVKYSDIAALLAMSTVDYKLIDYTRYRSVKDTIIDPIIVRGIAAGSIIDDAFSRGVDYYFVETGYFGNYRSEGNPNARKRWHRVVKNNMQHTRIIDVPDDRWRYLQACDSRLARSGWKKSGSKILIVAPSEKPCVYYGIDKNQWVHDTIEQLKLYTDREIIVREKASRTSRTTSNIIYDVFDQDIYSVVTYNSIAAIESVAYGIPAFALAPTAASPVCSSDLSQIENPYYPDEEFVYRWLCSLAYGQYNLEELLTGEAWRLIQENEQRPTISY